MGGKILVVWATVLGGCFVAPGEHGLGGDDVPPPSGVPILGFDTASSSHDETDGELDILMHLSQPSNEPITFWLELGGTATNGSDYAAIGHGPVFIAAGVDVASVTIQLADDGVAEPAETIELSLSMPTNCALDIERHTLEIRDNLLPRVTFGASVSGADERVPGSTSMLVMPASTVPITVDYTVSGGTASSSDYALQGGTITIPAGVSSFPFSFDHIDDGLDEDDETIIVSLSNPTNAILGTTTTNTHTIYDDDELPGVAFVVSRETVTEGDSGMQVLSTEVRLDRVSGRTVSVSFGPGEPQFFSATLSVDYTITTPSPLVFPPGTTSQIITYAILGDTVQDGSDTAAIKLTTSAQAYISDFSYHIIQIDNDDCYGTGVWRVCPDTAPTTDVTLDSTTNITTSFDGGPFCADRQPPGWIESGQPEACFIVARNITIGSQRFNGFRPLVLVALDSLTVNTVLDAGSHEIDFFSTAGPGHDPSTCATPPTSSLHLGAGGAGGSFMTAGGDGGRHGPTDPGGIAAPAVSPPTFLRGGCTAQQPLQTTTGLGGGAVYLLAGNTITILPNAVVNASGGGGRGSVINDGGSGGGSGGMIVLFAPSVIASQAHLLANGGGGAEGGDNSAEPGASGGDADLSNPFTPAAGGASTAGGDGGAGSVQGVAAVPGSNATSQRGAGGGGGGLGYILVHPSLNNAVSSPTPVTF